MAEIHKLSVEKTLNKIRGDDAKQSKDAAFKGKIDVLDEEIGRMRAQRQRFNAIKGSIIKKAPQRPLPRNVIRSESCIAFILVLALVSLWLYGLGHFRRAFRDRPPLT